LVRSTGSGFNGTQTATINTEHVLVDDTTHEGHVFDGKIHLNNMASGDSTTITLYEKALSGSTLSITYQATFVGGQSPQVLQILPLTLAKEWKLTLKQTAGTGRAYDWTVYSD
jgi:hypothetical protein